MAVDQSPFDIRHCTYLLQSLSQPNYIYIGYTVDVHHRIRQHNREIVGGAKKTKSKGPWRIICHISGFGDKVSAMQFEWRWQHPPGRRRKKRYYSSNTHRYKGVKRALHNLYKMLNMEQWTNNSQPSNTYNLTIHWHIDPELMPDVVPNHVNMEYV